MLILNMGLNFIFICNLEKLQVWQSKPSTYSCFHLQTIASTKLLNIKYNMDDRKETMEETQTTLVITKEALSKCYK
jgi:predicted metal-dependent hydrolase